MYFSSLGMSGKNIVGSGIKKIMPPESVFELLELSQDPRDTTSAPCQLGKQTIKVSEIYVNGPEVMERK